MQRPTKHTQRTAHDSEGEPAPRMHAVTRAAPPAPARAPAPSPTHALERTILLSWRALSGGSRTPDASRRTLIACSAGVDSSALALALASLVRAHKSRPSPFVLAHVQHDLREDHLAQADAARAQHLAQRLALPFALAHVHVRAQQGNPEALARAARYRALIALARDHACPFIATAHQGDDALETFLMRAMRGSGPRGLAGLLASRRTQGATIIRPMLALSREDTLAICNAHAWTPALDHTNFLPSSLPYLPADPHAHASAPLRTRVRALLVPTIKALFPHAVASTSRVTAVQHSLARSLQARSRRLTQRIHQHATPTAQGLSFPKALLLRHDDALLHETLRRLIAQHTKGQGLDALSTRATHRAITRIRSTSPHASTLRLGPAALHITRTTITITTRATP